MMLYFLLQNKITILIWINNHKSIYNQPVVISGNCYSYNHEIKVNFNLPKEPDIIKLELFGRPQFRQHLPRHCQSINMS